ncbi:ABC-type glutathione transport system ATPase component [Leucobacter exalbidus]|uniref:ABC-type glutathione transport system ATPase component n=1 Tax=Leucobacter exalbidus TaxID=662960 RepID=A0A940PZT0_9MICO|nr:ATP-binding cassette domain-containing protein [Leucobacter exalbidus]MBP1327116.1 ABC-type glutathione transport system ATPase component [Leucobacter exalbidus]
MGQTPAGRARPVALSLAGVTASHRTGSLARVALAPTTLEVHRGETVAVIGRSGAGKSTLADIVLGLRAPSNGQVEVLGEAWNSASRSPQRALRHLVQGVPQDPATAFVPRWSIRQNIARAVRQLTRDTNAEPRIRRAADLAQLDADLLDRRPAEISGGQAQRAAIARALAVDPAVLVADEPTSALDPATAQAVSAALLEVAADAHIALLLVTHDLALAGRCHRTITISAPTH